MKQAFTYSRKRKSAFQLKATRLTKYLILVIISILGRPSLQAQSYVQVPASGGIPSPTNNYGFGSSLNVRAAMLYRPSEMNNYPVAYPIERIGFKLAGPANGGGWGIYSNLKIYVIPTTDTIYNLSSNWSTIVNPTSGVFPVYDSFFGVSPSSNPPVTGFFDFILQTPFTLPPNHGFYLAYEYENGILSIMNAPFECNNSLANGYHLGYSNSHSPQTAPSTLTSSNNYRHILRLGNSGGTTGISESNTREAITVYPNPAQDVLNLELGSFGKSEIQVILRDFAGKVVTTQNLASNQNQLNLQGIPAGIYSLHLTSGSETLVKRIVIE